MANSKRKMPIGKSRAVLLFFTIFLGLFRTTFGNLILPEEYIRKVAARMVSIIEKDQITGKSMPLRTFDRELKITEYDVTAEGTVSFHSGFVSRIQTAFLSKTGYNAQVTNKQSVVSAIFVLNGIYAFYDVTYNLTDFSENGNFLMKFEDVTFDLTINRPHSTKIPKPTIRFLTTGAQSKLVIEVYPSNGYSQILANKMKSDMNFRKPLISSFADWETKWQSALVKAVADFDFPKICYYCRN